MNDVQAATEEAPPPPATPAPQEAPPPPPAPGQRMTLEEKMEQIRAKAVEVIGRHQLDLPPNMRKTLKANQATKTALSAREDLGWSLNELQMAWDTIFRLKEELEKAAIIIRQQQQPQTPAATRPLVEVASMGFLNAQLRQRKR